MGRWQILARLRRAQDGVATIEFAFLSLFFFGIMTVALDFGMYVQEKLKLGQAVEQGVILAFNIRDGDATTFKPATIQTFVKSTAKLTALPTVTCNNMTCVAKASRGASDYRCINQSSGAILSTAQASGAACTGGGNAGYYLKIVATKTYRPMVVPNRWLGGTTMTQSAVVRLS
jgi:Flp pilus assembly protein TadG